MKLFTGMNSQDYGFIELDEYIEEICDELHDICRYDAFMCLDCGCIFTVNDENIVNPDELFCPNCGSFIDDMGEFYQMKDFLGDSLETYDEKTGVLTIRTADADTGVTISLNEEVLRVSYDGDLEEIDLDSTIISNIKSVLEEYDLDVLKESIWHRKCQRLVGLGCWISGHQSLTFTTVEHCQHFYELLSEFGIEESDAHAIPLIYLVSVKNDLLENKARILDFASNKQLRTLDNLDIHITPSVRNMLQRILHLYDDRFQDIPSSVLWKCLDSKDKFVMFNAEGFYSGIIHMPKFMN